MGVEIKRRSQKITQSIRSVTTFHHFHRNMGFRLVVLLSFCCISVFSKTTLNVGNFYAITSYGAKGDGQTDDVNAFNQAWADVCKDNTNPTLIIPSGRTFLTSCLSFSGPCNSKRVYIRLLGDITAPKSIEGWHGCNANGQLIVFQYIIGLTIDGPGTFDGQGALWWPKHTPQLDGPVCDNGCATMLRFHSCNGLRLRRTKHINPPNSHIRINGCQGVLLANLQISAPGDSANTDGIDISASSHVNIQDSTIQTGDDCVAINGGTSDINITRVACGPGHGISIGSLGGGGTFVTVEQIRVQNCNITGTENGLRIKTVPNGKGYARGIVYQDIHLTNVNNPIIIDQHYCLSSLNGDCVIPPGADAVQVSDVTYTNIYGSSASEQAIIFNCSDTVKCTGIQTNNVNINGNGVVAYCDNTQGNFINTSPQISCN